MVTTAPDSDGLRAQPRHVLVIPDLPHALLLPRCAAVASQGGAGILFGALAHGVAPLLLLQGGDQFPTPTRPSARAQQR